MEPLREQHLLFSPPVWPRYENKHSRKRRRSHPNPESPAPNPQEPQIGWTPINNFPPSSSLPTIGPTPPGEQLQRENVEGSDSDADSGDEGVHPNLHIRHYARVLINHKLPHLPRGHGSLRLRHLTAMTAVLHRSLMEGDFARASRAYGLLIRCTDVDIRTMWGIGLEILLRRPEFNVAVGDGEGEPSRGEERDEGKRKAEEGEYQPPRRSQKTRSSPESVAKAIEYLNRLVLLYPYHRQLHTYHPAVVAATESTVAKHPKFRLKPSVLEFYPAFFNLLIRCSPYSEDQKPTSDKNPMMDRNPELHPEKIKEQLESLMMTPPWSDILSLWLLRGMVCNWIADLEGTDNAKWKKMKAEAKLCFENIREKGADLPEGVEGVEMGDEDDEDDEDDQDDVEMASEDE